MSEGDRQWVVGFVVGGERYQLSHAEARDVIRWMRTPKSGTTDVDLTSIAAAVFLERLVEEPANTTNPPMSDNEAKAVLMALLRKTVEDGLTSREAALHDALLAYWQSGRDDRV